MATKDTGGQERSARSSQDESQTTDEASAQDSASADVAERKAELAADVAAILDEIDEALEENAEEIACGEKEKKPFLVRGFVQKGGQFLYPDPTRPRALVASVATTRISASR